MIPSLEGIARIIGIVFSLTCLFSIRCPVPIPTAATKLMAKGQRSLLQQLRVVQVDVSPDRPLVAYQFTPSNEPGWRIAQLRLLTVGPGLGKGHRVDRHQDIHPHRRNTHLVKRPFLGEVLRGQAGQRPPNFNSDRYTRSAFSALESIHTSRSFV